mgnify:CR=1 FL=1
MDFHEPVRIAHIAAGSVALCAFWSAAALRKGTERHRLVGRVYLLAMLGIIVTSLPLAGIAFGKGRPVTGSFLLYLVLITATACFLAWRAVRARRDVGAYLATPYRPLAWLNLLAGAAMLLLGLRFGAPLLYGMSVVGLLVGGGMLRFSRRPADGPGWWLERHYGGVVGCGVATHIAFLNLGLQRLLPGDFSQPAMYLAWFGPLVAAVIATRWLDRRYGRGPAGRRLAQLATDS